ncbi:hypothetical protein ANN_08979 [Periplaneta americana]|uniref:HTH psq-type domain-containing protein n=1 Tax=Periplaneta americana TaxID=6978 RepID=A0ABQ8T2Q0_PERAM|nr:hypothetical protein ANN_08979 [Periplaneta americana]
MAPQTSTTAVGAVCRATANVGLRRAPRGFQTRTRPSSELKENLNSSLKTTRFQSSAVQVTSRRWRTLFQDLSIGGICLRELHISSEAAGAFQWTGADDALVSHGINCDMYLWSRMQQIQAHELRTDAIDLRRTQDNFTGRRRIRMPRSKPKYVPKGTRKLWEAEDMEKAIVAVREGKMGTLKASKYFHVPRITLQTLSKKTLVAPADAARTKLKALS